MFKAGSIRKITVKDFVTYSYVEMVPGPNLNMLIGPNGTGKSTIVAAIILGLGGSPKTVGRGTKLLMDEVSSSSIHFPPNVLLRQNDYFLLHAQETVSTAVVTHKYIRDVHIRMPEFYETWIGKYLECDFYTHFRMERTTFKNLLDDVVPPYVESRNRNKGGKSPVPVEKCLLITIWYLAKNELICSIGDRFNVANSTVCILIKEFCDYICKLQLKYIVWPNRDQCKTIAKHFKHLGGFPDVIGAIDGTHIRVTVPNDQQESYLDRKFTSSIAVQDVCTSEKLLTNVFVGFPGAAHDARVLTSSSIYREVEAKGEDFLFYGKYHLLGDSAYPCTTWLLTPYKKNRVLSETQKNYNYLHSSTRVKIENAFGLLKSRWQVLNFVNAYNITKVVKIVTACCVLHNFCILKKDFFEGDETEGTFLECGGENNPPNQSGFKKRNEIANMLQLQKSFKRRRLE